MIAAAAIRAQAQDGSPPSLATWADLDGVVANAYAGLTNVALIYPPGSPHFAIGGGYCTFTDDGEVAAATSLCASSTLFGVSVWQVSVAETQTTPRAWIYAGADGTCFRTNNLPLSDDPLQWVRDAYRHDAPDYLAGADLDQWYADRDRSRFSLVFTLVNSNDWPILQAAEQAATTNIPSSVAPYPALPADTNNLSFVGIQSSAGAMDLWVYTPAARPVAILTRSNLSGSASGWTLLGGFGSTPPFNLWHAASGAPSGFFKSGYTDLDRDGDGIPDLFETCILGTDPNCFDTVGSSLGDYYRVLVYGLDPLALDSDADGIPDAWDIANGFNPLDPSVGDQDPDGDGLCNRTEYLLGTSPHKPSYLDAANAATLRTATPLHR